MPRKTELLTYEQFVAENEELRVRLEEAEETLRAIHSGEVDALIISGADGEQIFPLKQAKEALQESEANFHTLVEEVNDGFYVMDSEGTFTFVNSALVRIFGVESAQKLIGRKYLDFFAPEMLKTLSEALRSTMQTGGAPEFISGQIVRPDGTRAFIEDKPVTKVKGGHVVGSQGVVRDITERKRVEEALRESEADFRRLFENSMTGISQALSDGTLIRVNSAYAQMYGYTNPEEMMAEAPNIGQRYFNPEDRIEVLRILSAKGIMEPREIAVLHRDGTRFFVLIGAREIRDSDGKMLRYQAEHVDITERKQAEEKIKRQLEHLTALSAIDRVIASVFDLGLSLSEILTHVTKELGVDAADVLTLNPISQILEYSCERGFRTVNIRNTRIRLSDSYAGRAVLERKPVQIRDLREEPNNILLTNRLTGEDFVCYYGVPLITKGQVKGVLEVFHRTALEPDAEWLDFLNTLAGQAAIAIENSTLFQNLQRSNSELAMAYDATIEGWSHALDLRDKETEGHTQRVTEMTVKLASKFGLSETELAQVRWGALLHDIGKMGVPDGLLHKPGPLSDDEWVIMKKHPLFAYEMLAPIHYLRLALDIPYCHHERWDGSGYPRQLKDEQIPLVARIFSVVDVWDALTSDRPYRLAWPEEKAREYIQAKAGTHFDPRVVSEFFKSP